jgi:hypothetical protein
MRPLDRLSTWGAAWLSPMPPGAAGAVRAAHRGKEPEEHGTPRQGGRGRVCPPDVYEPR